MSSPPAHQLDIIDAFLGHQQQGSFGCVLQGEGEALKCLVLALHTDLRLHLQGEANRVLNLE